MGEMQMPTARYGGGLLLLLQRRLLLLLLLLLLARHTAFHACGCRTLQFLPPNVTICH